MTFALRRRGVHVLTQGSFSPLSIAGLRAWWDFDSINTLWQDSAMTTPVTADGQTIGGVTDKSGNGKHLTQATAGARPLYKTNRFNGRSAVRFDKVDDFLQNTAMVADTSFTVFIVAKLLTGAVANNTLQMIGNANSQVYAPGGSNYTYFSGSPSALVGNALTLHSLAMRVNSASSLDFYASGGTPANIDPEDTVTTGTTFCYGSNQGANPSDFEIGEIIVYDSAFSAANLNLVGGHYLADRWGIAWTPVS